jgi:serine/threonine-protein kinase
MGTVWAATHTMTGKQVALKLLRPHGEDETARRRVLREARAACAVQHASVVAVHDVVESDDGLPVLVMDLLRGEPLRARLDRERTLPVEEALRIAEVVLGVLEVAHAAGVVHRDLKPDNLFLLEGGEVKLLDFGVAKLLSPDGGPPGAGKLTSTGAMVGTPYYMAPEQAFGDPIDGRVDLWAVGVVLFECLAGEPPTRADNLGQVLKLLSTGRIETLARRAPGVPPAVAAFVDGLLRVDPAERPPTARAALDVLRAARTGEAPALVEPAPVDPLPPMPTGPGAVRSIPPPPPRPRWERPALLGAALAAVAAALVVGLGPGKSAPPAVSTGALAVPAPGMASQTASTPPPPAPPPASAAPTPPPPTASAAPRPPLRTTGTAAPKVSASAPPTKLLTDVPF